MASLGAAIRGVTKEQLVQEEARQIRATVLTLAVITIAVAAGVYSLVKARDAATNQVVARQLASAAVRMLETSAATREAGLLSIEALRRQSNPEAAAALRDAIQSTAAASRKFDVPDPTVAVFCPDGQKIAFSTGMDVNVLSTKTGAVTRVRARFDRNVRAIACNSASTLIAAGGFDRVARVWDLAQSREVAALPHSQSIGLISFSGSNLVTATDAGDVAVWNLGSSASAVTKVQYGGFASVASLSAGGSLYAVADADAPRVLRWNVENGAEQPRIKVPGPVVAMAVSPAGDLLATAHEKSVRVWDGQGNEVRRIDVAGVPSGVAFSADGRRLGLSFAGYLRVAEVSTGAVVMRAVGGAGAFLAFDSSGSQILSAVPEMRVHTVAKHSWDRLWAAAGAIKRARALGSVVSLALQGTAGVGDRAALIDVETGRVVISPAWKDSAEDAYPVADGRVAVRMYKQNLLWKPDSNTVSPLPQGLESVSPDGEYGAFTTGGEIEIRRLPPGDVVLTSPGQFLAWKPRALEVAVRTGTRLVLIGRGKRTAIGDVPDENLNSAAFSGDGRILAVATSDNTLIRFDVIGGRRLSSSPLEGPVDLLDITRDGVRTLALGPLVKPVVYDGGRILTTFSDDAVSGAFTLDGKSVALAERGAAAVRRLSDAALELTVQHPSEVNLVRFQHDLLISASRSVVRAVRPWNTATLTQQACAVVRDNFNSEEWRRVVLAAAGGAGRCRPTCPNLPDPCR